MTHLPPIEKPVTDYAAFFEMFYKSRELAKQAYMEYTHITLDVGAAIKAYHVIWNNPQAWADIIIHLGDFHAMMAFFCDISCFVSGSGFEDILFQAGLCSSGSIAGLLSGKHYNRNGEFGKTPRAQFWALYMMMVDRQQKHHYAINTNDYNLRLLMRRKSLSLCFATNRVHYSRYGTFYVQSLENLESTHPRANPK